MNESFDDLSAEQEDAIARVKEIASPTPKKRKIRWKILNRSLHRDLGCIAFGLTLVYALSGIALHHFDTAIRAPGQATHTFQLAMPLPEDTQDFVELVVEKSDAETMPDSIYPDNASDRSRAETIGQDIELHWKEGRQVYVNLASGEATEHSQESRGILVLLNWLHAARGKPGWWVIGDAYGVILILLAFSGLMMIPKKKLYGRAGFLVLLGIAIPIGYAIIVLG